MTTHDRLSPLFVLGLSTCLAAQGATYRISLDAACRQANGASTSPDLSADGRLVAFASRAGNLVPGDGNGRQDVFVKDVFSARIERASVAGNGGDPNDHSFDPALSADGRYVVFASDAGNLISGDSNGWTDVFVRDRVAQTTTRDSVSSAGAQGNFYSLGPAISDDGRYVVFTSLASNLVAGDTNNSLDVFLRDRTLQQTVRVSVGASGAQGNDDSQDAHLSADGSLVVFASRAFNLVAGDGNGYLDVFVRDVRAQTTTRASMGLAGAEPNGDCRRPRISADGRYVVYESDASNLVAGDGNGTSDVFVFDRTARTTARVSVAMNGGSADAASRRPSLSGDGRYVAFDSDASNLVARQSWATEVYVRDLLAGTTTLVSQTSTGLVAGGNSGLSRIARQGRYVAFATEDSSMVPDDTNGADDVIVAEPWHHMTSTDSAHPGSPLRFQLRSPQDGGRTYAAMAAFNTQFGIRLGGRLFPLDLDAMLLFSLSAPSVFQNFVGAFDQAGNASATMLVPNSQGLIGLEFVTGYLVLDPASPAGISGLANSLFFQVW